MSPWYIFGLALSPLKWSVFFLVSRIHRTTRPRVALLCRDEVLLVQNWGDIEWSLPGGGLHHGETSLACAQRELKEELGIAMKSSEFEYIGIFELPMYRAPLFVVRVDKKPVLQLQKLEIHQAKWYHSNALPNSVILLEKLSF